MSAEPTATASTTPVASAEDASAPAAAAAAAATDAAAASSSTSPTASASGKKKSRNAHTLVREGEFDANNHYYPRVINASVREAAPAIAALLLLVRCRCVSPPLVSESHWRSLTIYAHVSLCGMSVRRSIRWCRTS